MLPGKVAALVDDLELIARFTAKPTGQSEIIPVATTTQARSFSIDLTPETLPSRSSQTRPLRGPSSALKRSPARSMDA